MRKDVEYRVFEGMKSPPRFGTGQLAYLRILDSLGWDLGVDDRRSLCHQVVSAVDARARDLRLAENVLVMIDEVVRAIDTLIREFATWKAGLVQRDDILGGEPVFPGTRLSVRHIGTKAQRGARAEILEDYPDLSERDVELARRFVVAYPRVGRPRAGETASR
ncbi:MAG: DUF433 domain-containing protein [Deltaproteobacteria bacterium]|nr:DUF433 domain-containing protein [Deltaproteobacteria bacterium]